MSVDQAITVYWNQIAAGKMLDLTASVGEVLSFEWFAGSFDVYLMRHSNAFRKCDFYGAKLIGSTSPTRYTLTSLPAYFASKQYCAAGQKLAVFESEIIFTRA